MSDSRPYACLYCECRFQYMGSRSVHVGQVHMNDILFEAKQAEPDNLCYASSGGDLNREYGISFGTVQEAATQCDADSSLLVTPSQVTSPAERRATGRRVTVAPRELEAEIRPDGGRAEMPAERGVPQLLAAEPGSEGVNVLRVGTASSAPAVQETGLLKSLRQEIECVFVDEGTLLKSPEDSGTARDPLSLEEETAALAGNLPSICSVQNIRKQDCEDPSVVTVLGGCVEEDPDVVCLGVYEAGSKGAGRRGHTSAATRTTTVTSTAVSDSEIGSTGRASPDSPHLVTRHGVDDAPTSGTMVSTGVASHLTPTNSCSGATGTDDRGISGDSGENRDFGVSGSSGAPGRKEPLPISELVIMAVMQSPHRRATLSEIGSYITSRFPQLGCGEEALHKLLSDCLCHNKCFVKVSPDDDERTSSDCWMLDPEFLDTVENGQFRQCGPEEPFYRGLAAAVAAHRVRRQLEQLRQRRGGGPSTLGAVAAVATSSSGGVDGVSPAAGPRRTSPATPTSTSLSVSDVGSTCPAAPDLSERRDDRYKDDPPMSDATSSVGDGTTRISATGGPAGDLACETAEERHSTGSVDTEPLLSYLRLSVMAILESPNRRATFSEICAYIENNCPYYGHEEGWQESLGISLSRNKSFVNVPQEGNDDRGDCWMLDMQYEDTHYDILRRPPLRGGSAVESTPTVSDSTGPAGTRRLCGVRDAGLSVRSRLLRLLALRTAAAVGSGSVGAVGGAAGCERRNSTAATPTCPSAVSANASVDGSGVTAGSAEDGGQLSGASGTADAKLPVCYEELIATAIAELPHRNSTAATPTCPSAVSANASVDGSGVTAGSVEDGGQLSGASGTADAKLPVCYEELIATAIAELPHRRTTASEISAYLSRYFPHFELSEKTWQKLVYHKLSSSKYFTKVRLKGGGLIRRYCWRLAEKYKDAFRNGSFGNRRLSARPQSGSGADNSPASTAGDLAGGRAVSTPASWEHRNSSIGPTSAGRSVSEDGSASWAAPDSSHPGVSHSEDGIPASDVTDVTGAPNPASGGFAGSIDSVTGTTVEGTAVGIAAGGENGERQLRETGTGSTADTRPKLSYKALITMAITQSPHRRATLSEICTYLTRRFPYFRQRRRVWGHSVSCTLCSSRCFVKVPREDGRGNYWTLDPQYKATFKSSKFRPSRCSKRPLRKAHTVPRGGGTADHPRDAQQQRQQLPRGATAAAATTTTTSTSTTRGSGVSDRDRQTARASQPPDCDGYESSTTTTTTTGLTIPKAGGPYTKPPFCYAELIAMALAHSPHRRATVSEIFAFVKSRFPYYKVSKKGWQKALQNKLSSRRWFTKVVRQGGERTPYWQLDPKYEHLFEGGNYRHRVLRHGRRRQNGAVSESGGPPDAGPPDLRAAAMADDDNGGGGDSLPLPSYLHCVKYELGSPESPEGNGSDSFDESNFQNATHDVAMTQPEDSTGLLSYCVPAPEPATREKDAFADVPLSICDVRSIKMEVFEDSVAPSGLSSCIKQEPDLELGSYGAENRLAATQGDTPDVTSTAAVTSQCLSVSDVGGPALDSSHPGGSCYEDDVPATDVSTSVGDAETPAYASGAASGSVGGGNGNTTSVPAGVTDEECSLGGGGSTDVVDTRPLLTYKALVAQAIEESPHRKLTMPEIYCYLIGRFPYFEKKKKSFRGTIRCTLSTNKCFLKVPQEGSCFNYWMLDPNYEKTASYRRRHHRERERPFHEGLGVGVGAASPPRSRRGSTEPAATDSSHPGDYCSEVDIRPPGRKTPADDATAATSPYGGRAERRIGVTGNVEAATPVGRAAAAVDEGESCSRGGPASTARSKLPFSYEELIAVAILESPHRTATLSEIKAYITSCFPYFECMKENLQNAIHSTLYFSKYFIKALPEGERRNCWTLDPKYMDTFESGKFEQHQIGKQPLSRALGVTTSSDEQQRRLSLPAQPRLPAALREHGSTTLTSTRLSYSNGRAAPDSSCRGSAYCKGETSESNLTSVTGDAGSQTFASCGSASSISAGTVSSEGIAGSDSAANTQLQLTRKQLITQAIMKSPHRKATLSEIYAYISSRYPSFRQRRTFHLRKISSKLSCSPCFVKVRQEGGSRGCWWTLGTKSTGAAATATSPSGGPDSRRSGAREGAAAKTKPPFSYEELIAMAILDSLHRRATVSEIIAYIARRFPYFERSNRSWQKSINCTLTFGKYFVKVPLRGVDIKGRCLNHWMLGPKYKEAVKTGKFRQLQGSRRPVRRPLVELPVAAPPSGAATVCRAGPPAAVDEHSFDPRTSDSYHLGKGRCRDDIWASDVKSTAAAATSSGRSGNSCISVTDNVREGSRVGSGGARTGEGAPCGGCGSAGVKPPFSYEQLIALAIEDSTHRRATLAEIVAYISRRFPYFERGNKSWQKSINCKLSFSKYFVKVPLQGGNIRSRCYNYWMLDPKYKNKIKKGNDNLGHLQCTKRPFGEAVGEAAVAAGCGQQQRGGGSVTGPTSASRSVSEGGSTGRASPDSPHPRGGRCEDDTPPSDTTTWTGDAGARACRVGVATGEEDGQCGAGSRPPLSHKALIAMAIAQAPHRRASRSEIYAYITRRFPYFRQKRKLWLNVIGTTLSTGKWFVKGGSSSSKGYYWTLDPQHEDMYKNGSFRRNRRSELPFRAAPDRSPLGPPSLHTAAAAGEPDATDGSRDTAGGALSSSDYPHYGECDESIANTVPNSPRLSDSEVGSSGHVPPDLSVPDSSHYEGDATVTSVTAASGDATTPAAALAGTADNYSDGTDPDSEGTAADGAADGVGEELRSGEAGPADSKPPFNYTQLCMMALEHSPHRRATWSQIAAYITRRFPYFEQKQGWQKCVGNTLTRHQFFINVKQKGARGNNSYWMLDPQYENTYKNINFRQNRHWKQPLREASEVPRSGLEPSSLRVAPAATDLGVCDVALPSSTYTQNGRYRESGISPTSRRLSISEVGNSGQVAPSPSDPVSGHYEDDTAATDVTAALGDASAHAGTTDSCSDGRGTAPGSGTNAKPPFNYAELCTVALEHSPHRRATWSEIAGYIVRRFPYFGRNGGWQNSVRNTLTRHWSFVNVKQVGGSYWTLDRHYKEMAESRSVHYHRRTKRRGGCGQQQRGGGSFGSPAEGGRSAVGSGDPPARDGPAVRSGDPAFPSGAHHDAFAAKHLLRVHDGERPHTCGVCGRAFRHRFLLKRHWLLHTGERPHSCAVCGRRFTRRDHLKLHAGDGPHRCGVCRKAFGRPFELKRHLRKVHAAPATFGERSVGADATDARADSRTR